MASLREPRYEFVCYKCLQYSPTNVDLLNRKCSSPGKHAGCREVKVWWWEAKAHLEVFYSQIPFGVPSIRPVPNVINRGSRYALCEYNSQCKRAKCTYAHSIEERDAWNDGARTYHGEAFVPDLEPEENVHPRRNSPKKASLEQRLDKSSKSKGYLLKKQPYDNMMIKRIQEAEEELTRQNYQQKFWALIDLEKDAHIKNLKERCDGKYTLTLEPPSRPEWLHKSLPQHKQYGYICGLNSDQILYAAQASEGLRGVKVILPKLCIESAADILKENYTHVDDKLYIAFDHTIAKPQTTDCEAIFALKSSYFDRLHYSVSNLSKEVISRLIPTVEDFGQVVTINDSALQEQLQYCTKFPDQSQALKAIVSTHPNGPPFLLTGAYGSGKTRILATTSHYFFQQQSQQPVRILVCTQQQVSADAFLECFIELKSKKMKELKIVRLITDFAKKKPEFSSLYQTVAEYSGVDGPNQWHKLVITTCSSALTMLNKGTHKPGYFTHILLDEGASMREPEAVAPFCFANESTKVVIAGDQHQVGPALLVEGENAQENGLAVSLLERLYVLYHSEQLKDAARAHHSMLVTNHRCHEEIVKLSELLFYDTPLKSAVDPGSTHPDAPFPLLFVCSCLDDIHQAVDIKPEEMKKEVDIALSQMKKFLQINWPADRWGMKKDFSQIAYASPTRIQLTLAGNILWSSEEYPDKMKDICRFPTYNIQGHEFRALFLSTAEPTWKDGTTRNPTKSICDRFVFNTVLSRARSLVVCVGNPFVLLRMERHMQKKYGEKAKCWSNYLRLCIEHDTLSVDESLGLSEQEKGESLEVLKVRIRQRLRDGPEPQTATILEASNPDRGKLDSTTDFKAAVSTTESAVDGFQISPISQRAHESRFETDYEVLGHLGRGGFGLVLHVKKKLENVDYAMKIIKLPNDKKDQEKVMREVAALANLGTSVLQRVVRYFTSWTEHLPPGWIGMDLWKNLKSTEQTYTPLHDQAPYTLRGSDSSVANTIKNSSEESSREESTFASVFDEENVSSTAVTEDHSGSLQVTCEPPTCLFIQTELCKPETLKDWLETHIKNRPRKQVLSYFIQILEAVDAIHKKGLVHRDLKPSNIFFSIEEDSLKVGDFGLVVSADQGALLSEKAGDTANGAGPQCHTVDVGTRLYMSPEQLAGKKYNNKVDIFALGLIFIELNYPFATHQEKVKVLQEIQKTVPMNFFTKLGPEATFFVQAQLLANEPGDRPTAEDVLNGDSLRMLKEKIETLLDTEMVPIII